MKARFWGTRGSIAKPGPTTIRYGGNTSCVQVTTDDGTLLIFDCGTGAHALGAHLMAGASGKIRGNILLGHTHWDHIQGIPFFAPLFIPGHEWDIYAPGSLGAQLREILAGQMEYAYFPVSLTQLGATIRFHELREETFSIGSARISTHSLNHPALTLGFRVEADGATLVYATDHEPHGREACNPSPEHAGHAHPGDRRHHVFVTGADLLIHDTQYTAEEYPRRVGWGHSTLEYVVDLAIKAEVGRLALFHHDPMRSDDAVDGLVERSRAIVASAGSALDVLAAAEGLELDVTPVGARDGQGRSRQPIHAPAEPSAPRPRAREVIVQLEDPALRQTVEAALAFCGLRPIEPLGGTAEAESALLSIVSPSRFPGPSNVPSVVIVPQTDEGAWLRQEERSDLLDVVSWPCSVQYLRARMEAWMMRQAPRWQRAAMPLDEATRVAHVKALRLLDTPAEERFERLVRLARRAFDVPVGVVSLIDAERQWLKTQTHHLATECPRDVSICAHAILRDAALVIEDLAQDPQFADNPAVTERRLRFYAGVPLRDRHGFAVGTLCLMHVLPRAFSTEDTHLLEDLARLVEVELSR